MALNVLTAASLQASDLSSKRRSSAFPSLQDRASATASADGIDVPFRNTSCRAEMGMQLHGPSKEVRMIIYQNISPNLLLFVTVKWQIHWGI
jgi:hypothetical protein